jgi:hypothetical protein
MIQADKKIQCDFMRFNFKSILRLVVFFILVLLMNNVSGQLDTATVRTFGGDFFEEGRQVIECTSGGYCVIGTTGSDEANGTNIYLLRTDEDLNCIWSKSIGGVQADKGYSLVENESGGFVLCGYTNSFGHGGFDVLVYQVDALGETEWMTTFGGSDWDFGYKIIRHPDGGYLICGETYSLGNGDTDGYFLHIANDGSLITEWTFGWEGEDEFVDVDYWYNSEGDKIILTGNTKSAEASALWKGWIFSLDYESGVGESYYQEDEVNSILLTASDTDSEWLHFCGSVNVGYPIAMRGRYSPLFELSDYSAFDVGGEYVFNEVIAIGDTLMVIGETTVFGGGGKDGMSYFFQGLSYINGPTFGSYGMEVFYSGLYSSDHNVVITGVSESLNEGVQPQLLLVKIDTIVSTVYYQDLHLMDDCFYVSLEENGDKLSDLKLVEEICFDLSGRLIWNSVNSNEFLDRSLMKDGIYFMRKKFENGDMTVEKFLVQH